MRPPLRLHVGQSFGSRFLDWSTTVRMPALSAFRLWPRRAVGPRAVIGQHWTDSLTVKVREDGCVVKVHAVRFVDRGVQIRPAPVATQGRTDRVVAALVRKP